jgi:hypothetical protein
LETLLQHVCDTICFNIGWREKGDFSCRPTPSGGGIVLTSKASGIKKEKTPARIEYLKVSNFRALQDIEMKNLTPLTVLLGPNGSGKSTVFDVFAFLAECFEIGLRRAWDKRGRAKEIKTKGCDGPVVVEIKYRERGYPLITYHLSVDEKNRQPVVVEEWLQWRRGRRGKPRSAVLQFFFDFLHCLR